MAARSYSNKEFEKILKKVLNGVDENDSAELKEVAGETQVVFDSLLKKIINGIDATESTEWDIKSRTVSENIRKALVSQLSAMNGECDSRFLDYCNALKALLAIYNFGNLNLEDEADAQEQAEWVKSDKQLMLNGISAVLDHVQSVGYDITPYIDEEENRNIFASEAGKSIQVTMSVTTVFMTLVYFRRAYKREGIFDEHDVAERDVMERVIRTVSEILVLFVKYIESNKYAGWGFTFDSRAVTLNDTYAVVDAISRFADAFTKDDKLKRDDEFIKAVNDYAEKVLGEVAIVDRCLNSMYKAAYNVYDRTKDVYGQSIFYSNAERGKDDSVHYVYAKTDYEQISNSNRSSALFNPLYVAMITMYGYNEKEIVIRRFMDDYEFANEIYNEFEVELAKNPNGKKTISDYAKTLDGFANHTELSFEEEAKLLREKHAPRSNDYSDNAQWRRYYRIARVFQKYLETQEPDRLMDIAEYRDYLNATKDAIDQVQIMYRNFDNNQRLGVVDTDYVLFSALDINTDIVNISKLNKANISVNNLRPMLLSSKIMIVNALTKYPQSDLEELYNAIIAAQYQKSISKTEKENEWLWNADRVDMNSTARHCEAITYDYFDYYERYELGLKAINGLKSNLGSAVTGALDKTGAFSVDKLLRSDEMISFKRVVLAITHRNVELVRSSYQSSLRTQEREHEKDLEELRKEINNLKQEKENLLAQKEAEKEELRQKHIQELAALDQSRKIGDTLRNWIREETDKHITETLSMIILNTLNGGASARTFTLDDLLDVRGGTPYYAGFNSVKELGERIKSEYQENPQQACERYNPAFKKALALQRLFEGAFDGIIELQELNDFIITLNSGSLSYEERDGEIADFYKDRKHERKVGEEFVRFKDSDIDE